MIRIPLVCLWFLLITSHVILGGISTTPSSNAPKRANDYLKNLKKNFSKALTDTFLEHSSFLQKFDVPYLGTGNGIYYATEVSKAIAFAPLFNRENEIEKYVLERLVNFMLPSSTTSCEDIWCIVLNIGEIIANVTVDGGFVSPKASQQVIAMTANNVGGNVLWRLSRVPDPDMGIITLMSGMSRQSASQFGRFVRFLSAEILKSKLVSGFIGKEGIDVNNSVILSSNVCGSRFLGFNLGLISNVSSHMQNLYHDARSIYSQYMSSKIDNMVMASIIAETIALGMLNQHYFEDLDYTDDTARDVLKLITVGITTSRMKIHGGNVDRHSLKR